ncbi:acyl-CoA dehydrogenase family protein [Nocardiopsis composta]
MCGAARAWGRGDHAPGRALWRALADAGVFALAVPEEHGGAGVRPVELVAALIEVGRHGVPGPVVETLAAAQVLGDPKALAGIADGSLAATLALPPLVPYALDADAADLVLTVHGDALHRAEPAGGRTARWTRPAGCSPAPPPARSPPRSPLPPPPPRSSPRWPAPPRPWGRAAAYWTPPWPTSAPASSSAARSGSSRRSSTGWPTP